MSDNSVRPQRGSLAERVARRIGAETANSNAQAIAPRVPTADTTMGAVGDEVLSPTPSDSAIAVTVAPTIAPSEADSGEATVRTAAFVDIDSARLLAAGFITPDSPRSGQAEELRVIKQQMLKLAFTEDRRRRSAKSNVIMLTSSLPAEGKTFVSLNLAMSLCNERDTFVLLIDADSHRRSLSELVGVDDKSIGLIDLVLDDRLRLSDIMHRTSIPNLSFIPAGRPHQNAAELLASKKTGAVMADIAARYPDRIVVIDTPPLMASTEGAVLSAYVGHVIVVVEKDRTSIRSLRNTLTMLKGCENISCVLNFDGSSEHFSRYAYGY